MDSGLRRPMNKHLKKISEEVLHANPWFKYKHDVFQLSDKNSGDYYYLETNGCAMVVPILDDGRLVLVRQYRYLREKESIEFPCGGLNIGESPQDAANRELTEETGYKAHEFAKIGVFEGLKGLVKDACHVFIAEQLDQVGEPYHDPTESIELIVRRPDEVDQMVRKNEIWDGQTLAAWALVHHHLLHK